MNFGTARVAIESGLKLVARAEAKRWLPLHSVTTPHEGC